jgi:NADH-quinone oxidoreductase subunit G
VGEEEIDALVQSLSKRKDFTLVVGADLYSHPRVENIAKLIALIEKHGSFDVVAIPPATNALGVALICKLDNQVGDYTIGYNSRGDFTLSALGEGDLDMPSLNQQEGTFTTINKQVVPTNAALEYKGYVLNDIASALGVKREYTIDYTQELPIDKGYQDVAFDDLKVDFGINGEDLRGYRLQTQGVDSDSILEEIAPLPTYDGLVLYRANAINQFSPFTHKAKELQSQEFLRGSSQFALAAKISDGDEVKFELDGVKYTRVFKIDTSMKGTVAINPTNDKGLSSTLVSSYRYAKLILDVQNK